MLLPVVPCMEKTQVSAGRDEKHTIDPQSQYGVSKHTVEYYLFVFKQAHNLPYTVLRYPNVYGPRQNPHGEVGVVAIFTEQMLDGKQPTIFGDGTKTRDYVYDLVNANMMAMFNQAELDGGNAITLVGVKKQKI